MTPLNESVVEQAALAWLESLGYVIVSGPEIAPGEPQAEREEYGQVVLERRLRQALQRLNPQVPADALDEALRKLTRPDSPSLVANNHIVHKYLVEGVPVEYQRADGTMAGDLVRIDRSPEDVADVVQPEVAGKRFGLLNTIHVALQICRLASCLPPTHQSDGEGSIDPQLAVWNAVRLFPPKSGQHSFSRSHSSHRLSQL